MRFSSADLLHSLVSYVIPKTSPKMSLSNKKNSFVLNSEATLAFSLLKDSMSSTLVLETPDFGKTFIVECDVSRQEIGVILMQEGRPLAF
jgi:hypothetical protein